MKIAIPTDNDAGCDSKISSHFGSAPYYAIYDQAAKELFYIKNEEKDHVHGQCQPTAELIRTGITAVICNSLGFRAINNLEKIGIKVYFSNNAKNIKEVIEKIEASDLPEYNVENVCQQHQCH